MAKTARSQSQTSPPDLIERLATQQPHHHLPLARDAPPLAPGASGPNLLVHRQPSLDIAPPPILCPRELGADHDLRSASHNNPIAYSAKVACCEGVRSGAVTWSRKQSTRASTSSSAGSGIRANYCDSNESSGHRDSSGTQFRHSTRPLRMVPRGPWQPHRANAPSAGAPWLVRFCSCEPVRSRLWSSRQPSSGTDRFRRPPPMVNRNAWEKPLPIASKYRAAVSVPGNVLARSALILTRSTVAAPYAQ